MERFRSLIGNPQNYLLGAVDKVEATDRYTVKVTLKEPYVWFPDIVANPMTGAIVAREAVDKFGDLKKWEATVGTGPWMLDSYRPNIGMTLVRNPHYFVPGLPYMDRVELVVDEDQSSRMAAFLSGKYDLGPEFMGTINRPDGNQLKDQLAKHRPGLRTLDLASNVRMGVTMRSDRPPFSDVRVRRALSLALTARPSSRLSPMAQRSSIRRVFPWHSRTGRYRSISSVRARNTTSTTLPKPAAFSLRPATRGALRPWSISTASARRRWSTGPSSSPRI
jgi:ABC-type transport system substrate-binding protein